MILQLKRNGTSPFTAKTFVPLHKEKKKTIFILCFKIYTHFINRQPTIKLVPTRQRKIQSMKRLEETREMHFSSHIVNGRRKRRVRKPSKIKDCSTGIQDGAHWTPQINGTFATRLLKKSTLHFTLSVQQPSDLLARTHGFS